MQQIIGLKEFKNNPDVYAKKVSQGHSFIVVKQSKPLFKVSSPVLDEIPEIDLEEADGPGWKTVIDFTKIQKGGVPVERVAESLSAMNKYGQNTKSSSKTAKRISRNS